MRQVIVYKMTKLEGYSFCSKVKDGFAKFHQFGTNFSEFEEGPGNYSTAIIEREDGAVDNVPVEMIQFVDTYESTGIDLIKKERTEQIVKHGYDAEHDSNPFNKNGELAQVAAWLIGGGAAGYPQEWSYEYYEKLSGKSEAERLVIAGALIAAEIDRLNNIGDKE